MKDRTISMMVGKGSIRHNERKFIAPNVDRHRTDTNIEFCDDDIREVYHELFDEALKKYNEKQTRSDRKIDDYFEKIQSSRQEKTFHEIVIQVGDKDDMAVESEEGKDATEILKEYYEDFVRRNPQLRVFSAHLHLDESTPHLHIDFVPFTSESKRGLETRVSLKQALALEGFKGGTSGDTEWNQWVANEKSHLASIMMEHGYSWYHKDLHREHLSVLDYKKQEREKEVQELDKQLQEKKEIIEEINSHKASVKLYDLTEDIKSNPKYQLPDPPVLMTAKTYREKFVDPLIKRLKSLLLRAQKDIYGLENLRNEAEKKAEELSNENFELRKQNEYLNYHVSDLERECKGFEGIVKAFGIKYVNNLLDAAWKKLMEKEQNANRENDVVFEDMASDFPKAEKKKYSYER